MINMMKWHHINTIKYQCTDLIINIIIIYKVKVHQLKSYQKLKSISFSEYHFNWLSFFSSITFSRGVKSFASFSQVIRYFTSNFFYLFFHLFFQFVWLSESLVESVFTYFFIYFVPDVVVKRITIWEWWGHSVRLINVLPIFSLNKSWTILAQHDSALSWIKIQVFLFIIRLISGSSFSKCFLYVLELTFIHKKWLHSTFPRYTSRNHYFFRLSIGVTEKAILLNIIFMFKSMTTTVLRV